MTLKLEVGKTYLNKLGQKVRVICIDGKTEVCGDESLPVIGLVETPNGLEKVETYTNKGTCLYSMFSDKDLVSEYREPDYRWFNTYKTWNTNPFYKSKKEAMRNADRQGNYVGTYRIDLITGDITKEEDK